jgi:hypothetical protein
MDIRFIPFVFRLVTASTILLQFAGAAEPTTSLGTVAMWGSSSGFEVPPDLTNVVAIGAGVGHAWAVRQDGSLVGWGVRSVVSRMPAGLSDVIVVAPGFYHCTALKRDGTVIGWGVAQYGETNIPPGLSNVVSVAAGWLHNVALKSDGTVVTWGWNGYGQTTIPPGLSGVIAVAAGAYHSLVLKSDGTVVAWGKNEAGEGQVPPNLPPIVAIDGGYSHNLGLTADGGVVVWGENGFGQLDVPVGLTNIVAIDAGAGHNLVLKPDGTVVAWGDNRNGQSVVPPGLPPALAIAAGFPESVALVKANVAPHAIATASPLVDLGQPPTSLWILSGNGSNAVVTLDGSQSFDPENDPLRFQWYFQDQPQPFAEGTLVNHVLDLGSHQIVLAINDGHSTSTDALTVEVLSTTDAVGIVMAQLEETFVPRKVMRSLIVTLEAATAALERGDPAAAAHQLQAFQNKVRANLALIDPVAAERLIAWTQQIIEASE